MSSIHVASDRGLTSEDEVARLVEERRNNIRKVSLQTGMLLGSTAAEGQGGGGGSTSAASDDAGGGRNSGTGIGADQPTLLLGIGTGGADDFGPDGQYDEPEGIVSESPTTAEFDVYDRAFQTEVKRIQSQGNNSKFYPNKVLESKGGSGGGGGGSSSMADVVARLLKESKS